MAEAMRFLAAGGEAVLVELDDLGQTLALLDLLKDSKPRGVHELVPGARTLLVRYNPLLTDRATLIHTIGQIDLSAHTARQGKAIDIPITYDGEDLGSIADILGWSVNELVRRHMAATYTVAFTGFAPGFAYMISDDPDIDVPRRSTPRVRVPAGTVALAGKFGGIYPTDSPGGWQLLGTTPLGMWDMHRDKPALLAPGDRVQFRNMAKGSSVTVPGATPEPAAKTKVTRGLRVLRCDRPALYQDMGRPGRADQGISQSGALDRAALREANICVGNPVGAAAIEISFGGFELKADQPVTMAVTGAPCPLEIRPSEGGRISAPFGQPFALDEGDVISLGIPLSGMRSYLAVRGGFGVAPVLGAAAYDTLAKVGPDPIGEGDILEPATAPAVAVDAQRPAPPALPKAGDMVTLDLLLGPRMDWFTDDGVETLLLQPWRVTPESSRVGLRLSGDKPLQRRDARELPSEGTVRGSVQVPHNGQPVLFLADHPLTGGYPVIGVVAPHHLDLAGQIPIGAMIRFNSIAAFEPVAENVAL